MLYYFWWLPNHIGKICKLQLGMCLTLCGYLSTQQERLKVAAGRDRVYHMISYVYINIDGPLVLVFVSCHFWPTGPSIARQCQKHIVFTPWASDTQWYQPNVAEDLAWCSQTARAVGRCRRRITPGYTLRTIDHSRHNRGFGSHKLTHSRAWCTCHMSLHFHHAMVIVCLTVRALGPWVAFPFSCADWVHSHNSQRKEEPDTQKQSIPTQCVSSGTVDMIWT